MCIGKREVGRLAWPQRAAQKGIGKTGEVFATEADNAHGAPSGGRSHGHDGVTMAFSVMFFAFPAGLVLYWITNNIWSIAQQWIINTRMGVPPQFNLPKFK